MALSALVVDDSMLIRHTVCRVLEGRGFLVESATNGVEALELLVNLQPDLIVTDLQMPKMDGYQFMAALKKDPKTATIPVVVLAQRQSTEQSTDDRARWVIFKDIDIADQLRRAVETILPASTIR
ncbi:MAG: response regulator [Acidobacteriia bacterium]|nr:response regulator [Terriglobia bacterium]